MWNPNEGLHYNWQHNSLHVANPLYRLRERTADPTPYEISESERTATDAAWAELCSESGAPSCDRPELLSHGASTSSNGEHPSADTTKNKRKRDEDKSTDITAAMGTKAGAAAALSASKRAKKEDRVPLTLAEATAAAAKVGSSIIVEEEVMFGGQRTTVTKTVNSNSDAAKEAAIAAERKSQLVVLWGTHFLLNLCWSWVERGFYRRYVCLAAR